MIRVPSIGFAGLAQQTRAAQLVYQRGMRASGGSRGTRTAAPRKRRAKKKRAARAAGNWAQRNYRRFRRSRRTAGKAKRFTKGSAAAKRHMAKLRAMRKR